MLYLTLTEIAEPGGPVTQLGTIQIKLERESKTEQVGSYVLKSQGQRVGAVQGWQQWQGPWRLAQAAINAVYGGLESPRNAKLKNDGHCNAISSRGKRCRLEAQDGGYFCVVHDRVR